MDTTTKRPVVIGQLLANNWRVIETYPDPVDLAKRVIVLATMPGRRQPYATWTSLVADDNSTEVGHYFSSLADAVADLYSRARIEP